MPRHKPKPLDINPPEAVVELKIHPRAWGSRRFVGFPITSVTACVTITRKIGQATSWDGEIVALPVGPPHSPPLIMPDISAAIGLIRNHRKRMVEEFNGFELFHEWHHLRHFDPPFARLDRTYVEQLLIKGLDNEWGRRKHLSELRKQFGGNEFPWSPVTLLHASPSLTTNVHWVLATNWRKWFRRKLPLKEQLTECKRVTGASCSYNAFRGRLRYLKLPDSEKALEAMRLAGDEHLQEIL